MKRHRNAVALVAVAVAALAAPVASAVTAPSVPSPNVPTPHVHLPKPDEAAYFEVTVEGTATDHNVSKLDGLSGPCAVSESGTVDETTTYLRGRGVVMEFARYGHRIEMVRKGRTSDTSLAVQTSIKRTASGGTTNTPYTDIPCDVPNTDISKDSDCAQPVQVPTNMVMQYTNGWIHLKIGSTSLLKIPLSNCGEDSETGLDDYLAYSWPTPVPLQEEHIPMSFHALFGSHKSFAVTLRNGSLGAPKQLDRDVVSNGNFRGHLTDVGTNKATIRFKRVKS